MIKEVIKTIYKTKDGKEFDNYLEAYNHELDSMSVQDLKEEIIKKETEIAELKKEVELLKAHTSETQQINPTAMPFPTNPWVYPGKPQSPWEECPPIRYFDSGIYNGAETPTKSINDK